LLLSHLFIFLIRGKLCFAIRGHSYKLLGRFFGLLHEWFFFASQTADV